ncbi:MAG: hypothetical protein A2079_07180 [Geobacteraceae bacterium GWC2_48_7]|nr:MAG: hypothetical protein A2079_07180 [Geobacteraceae bacterium GWC2_48_7]
MATLASWLTSFFTLAKEISDIVFSGMDGQGAGTTIALKGLSAPQDGPRPRPIKQIFVSAKPV